MKRLILLTLLASGALGSLSIASAPARSTSAHPVVLPSVWTRLTESPWTYDNPTSQTQRPVGSGVNMEDHEITITLQSRTLEFPGEVTGSLNNGPAWTSNFTPLGPVYFGFSDIGGDVSIQPGGTTTFYWIVDENTGTETWTRDNGSSSDVVARSYDRFSNPQGRKMRFEASGGQVF